MKHYNCEPNRWKGFVLGLAGSLAGLMAMRYYWQYVAPFLSEFDGDGQADQSDELNDISLVGKQYQEDESSTAALGRLAYEQVAGKSPRAQETKTMLSYLIHWAYGIL